MKRVSLPALVALTCLGLPARASDALSVVAELPSAFPSGTLDARPLGRDGKPWLVSVSTDGIQAWRAGSVSEPVRSFPAGGGGKSPVFADFDADGLLDLAYLRGAPWTPPVEIAVLSGDGVGHFSERTIVRVDGQAWALAAGDVDGDGRPDLVLARAGDQGEAPSLRTFRSLGGFGLAAPKETALGPYDGVSSLAAADLDGDGRADLVLSPFMGSVSVWTNAGDGTFAASTTGLPGYYAGPAIFADFDGDGRLDFAFRDSIRGMAFYLEVCRNEGTGVFSFAGRIEIRYRSSLLALADEDGDGDIDLLVRQAEGDGTSPRIGVFHGNGRGGFGAEVRLPLPAYAPIGSSPYLVPLDWSADGRLEFVLSSGRGPVVLGEAGARTDLFAGPVLVATTGLLGSRFDSDLLLTNAGTTTATVELVYSASAGGGSGVVTREIAPGRQLFAPSAIGFLRDAGLPIAADGPAVGTLRARVAGAALPSSVRATVRTATPGGAGVSYAGVPSLDALRAEAVVPWLVESDRDRTNLALVNAGTDADGPVTLSVTVVSGDPGRPGEAVLPDVVLPPGGFFQIGHVLAESGLASGLAWARVSRTSGSAPFLAWATVNDNGSGDGSFVPAVVSGRSLASCQTIATVVQSARYATELVVTNPGGSPAPLRVTLVATGTLLTETLAPRQTLHVPDLFAELRRRGLAGAPAEGDAIASPLYVCAAVFPRVVAGARASTRAGEARYGLFEAGVPEDLLPVSSVVVPDLRQDAATRTNLGITNEGPAASFRLEIRDGDTGTLAATRDLSLASGELVQLNSVLRDLAPGTRRGWARVVPLSSARFLAWGVVMDGPEPGVASDDGSFVFGLPE